MEKKEIAVTASGLAPIMFDRFYDLSQTKRPPEDKVYLHDGFMVLPPDNIWAFLSCQRTGCAKVFEGKGWMDYYRACGSFVRIQEHDILPFLNDNRKAIKFDNFKKLTYIYTTNVRVGHGQNTKRDKISRPVLRLPWQVDFHLILFDNELITIQKLEEWFRVGGLLIAWGNGRPKFGRFEIIKWDVS